MCNYCANTLGPAYGPMYVQYIGPEPGRNKARRRSSPSAPKTRVDCDAAFKSLGERCYNVCRKCNFLRTLYEYKLSLSPQHSPPAIY